MATSEKHTTGAYSQPGSGRSESPSVERPSGWKYRALKLGSVNIPWYASPEAQLLLVSFVCFLCPGKITCPTRLQLADELRHV